MPHRKTNGNYKMLCSGILGSIRLDRLKAPTPHCTTFFYARKTLRIFLIRVRKNVSYPEY